MITLDDSKELFGKHWMPKTPLASSDLESGMRRMDRESASQHRYIEAQPSALKNMIIIDLDFPEAGMKLKSLAYDDESIPEPNIIVTNPATSHAHGYYFLKGAISVGTRADSFYRSVSRTLRTASGGDAAFAGKIARSPFQHFLEGLREEPYTLQELKNGIRNFKSIASTPRKEQEEGLGRNVDLFNSLRTHAYRSARGLGYSSEAIYADLYNRALELNIEMFASDPQSILGNSEIKSICRSITKFVCSKFSEESFSKLQATRATRRWDTSKESRQERKDLALFLKSEGFSSKEIGEELGMKPASVRSLISRASS